MGATITDLKPLEINIEIIVYTPSRGPNMPFQGYKGFSGVIIKSYGQYRGLIILWEHLHVGL